MCVTFLRTKPKSGAVSDNKKSDSHLGFHWNNSNRPPPPPVLLLGPCSSAIEIIFTMAWIIILKQSKTVANLNCWISPLLELRWLFLTARFLLWTFCKTESWYFFNFFPLKPAPVYIFQLKLFIKEAMSRYLLCHAICYVTLSVMSRYLLINWIPNIKPQYFYLSTFWAHELFPVVCCNGCQGWTMIQT